MISVGAIRETFVNASEGHLIGEDICADLFSSDPGELFRKCRAEYGRCIGKVYLDTAEGSRACGWVFVGRDLYEDTEETYLREVWVQLLAKPDTASVERHPFFL